MKFSEWVKLKEMGTSTGDIAGFSPRLFDSPFSMLPAMSSIMMAKIRPDQVNKDECDCGCPKCEKAEKKAKKKKKK